MKTECINKMLSNKKKRHFISTILILFYPQFDLFVKISQKVCNHLNTPFSFNTYVTYILLPIQFDHCLERNYYSTMVAVPT